MFILLHTIQSGCSTPSPPWIRVTNKERHDHHLFWHKTSKFCCFFGSFQMQVVINLVFTWIGPEMKFGSPRNYQISHFTTFTHIKTCKIKTFKTKVCGLVSIRDWLGGWITRVSADVYQKGQKIWDEGFQIMSPKIWYFFVVDLENNKIIKSLCKVPHLAAIWRGLEPPHWDLWAREVQSWPVGHCTPSHS